MEPLQNKIRAAIPEKLPCISPQLLKPVECLKGAKQPQLVQAMVCGKRQFAKLTGKRPS